jgi:hypothetical protein
MEDLKKWLLIFCKEFGLQPIILSSNELTPEEIIGYSLVTSHNLKDELVKYKNFDTVRLWKMRVWRYFYFKGKQGVGSLQPEDVNYFINVVDEARKNVQTNDMVVNYVIYDKKLLKLLESAAYKIKKFKLAGTLPIIEGGPFQILLHEGIHHVLHNNGLRYHWNSITEGLCVFLHLRMIENRRLFHVSQGSPVEKKRILKEMNLVASFYRAGAYSRQIRIWAEYFDVTFGKLKDIQLISAIRRKPEMTLVAEMQAYLKNRYNIYKQIQYYENA